MFKKDHRKQVYNLVTPTGELLDRAIRLKSHLEKDYELNDVDAAQLWEARRIIEDLWHGLKGDNYENV